MSFWKCLPSAPWISSNTGDSHLIPPPDTSSVSQTSENPAMVVERGPCSFKTCSCIIGQFNAVAPVDYPQEPIQKRVCFECGHSLSDHHNKSVHIIPSQGGPDNGIQSFGNAEVVSQVWCPRELMVDSIIKVLHQERFVHVRGTPASGKSTLCNLIMSKVQMMDKQAITVMFIGWNEEKADKLGGWDKLLRARTGYSARDLLNSPKKTYLFVDEGQATYPAADLWSGLFKEITDVYGPYTIVFSSYGSAGSNPNNQILPQTPQHLQLCQRISLVPAEIVLRSRETVKIGLLLDLEETIDVIRRYSDILPDKPVFTTRCCETIYKQTSGHVGATVALTSELATLKKYKGDPMATVIDNDFAQTELIEATDLLERLTNARFARGLPGPRSLSNPIFTNIFESVLQSGYTDLSMVKERVGEKKFDKQKYADGLEYMYKSGWVQAELKNPRLEDQVYVLPSRLHHWFIHLQYHPLKRSGELPYSSPIDLVEACIGIFDRNQLLAAQNTPQPTRLAFKEAAFHFEFYRTMYQVLDGQVYCTAEFGDVRQAGKGSIDLFLKSPGWGFELIHNGDRIGKHKSRFETGGAYEQWMGEVMHDYILLDFRTKPKNKTEGGKYYSVIFTEDLYHVELFGPDNSLRKSWSLR